MYAAASGEPVMPGKSTLASVGPIEGAGMPGEPDKPSLGKPGGAMGGPATPDRGTLASVEPIEEAGMPGRPDKPVLDKPGEQDKPVEERAANNAS